MGTDHQNDDAGRADSKGPTLVVGAMLARASWLPVLLIVALLALFVWRTLRTLEQATGSGHAGSWVALAAGVLLAGSSWLLTHLARNNMKTRRRLDRSERDALVDELTGLLNRKGIAADIEQRLVDRSPSELVGVLFCDLDRLKVVNDSLGHSAGDQVLQVAAARLARLVRGVDTIGRFGGDEFVIVSSGLPTVRDLEILAERLTEALQEPTVLADGSAQVVSGSIGIAWVAGPDSAEAGDLLRDADVAMYQAKQAGGGRFAFFDSSLRAQAVARLELEQELRQGIGRGEVAVHYQPIVDQRNGRVERFEALVRWEHPTRGVVHPADFLPVASESLLIVELGQIVLHDACRQAVAWSTAAGRPIAVSVNVAERQLLDLSLVGTVSKALAETGLPPGQLELELSEELIMTRIDHSFVVLRQLDLLGVRLAIDDFGTSQASLSQLKNLAMVSTLKIDRAFIEAIATDEVDRKIVSAIVALASSIGMTVVAEGVESEQQARILGRLGVDRLQGFLFRRPGAAEEMNELLDAEHTTHWAYSSVV